MYKELLPAIHQMVAAGKTQREIAEYYGFKDKEVVKEALKRERRKEVTGIPKQRGRKPAKILAEYKYENQRLKMENELLRNFLQFTERKRLFTDIVKNIPYRLRAVFSECFEVVITILSTEWADPKRTLHWRKKFVSDKRKVSRPTAIAECICH